MNKIKYLWWHGKAKILRKNCRLSVAVASRNTKIYVGLRKASNATCYNAGNPRNAVAPQPTNTYFHAIPNFLNVMLY
ncbi:hypothetical protein [Nostoc sp. TCL26-01]|uniref:hypothetical protein n=1 Tax=Nostoc sp. TCL26-01 TaxID=2576904 RepID=UPI0015B869F7|nr:hypothetical protein [Nostoc sp. TCL26-01]QLE58901.1 hypothetical protein FD725_27425 [Nostoc sp. TCL26-01]